MAIKTTDFPILTDDLQELTVTTMNHAVAEMDTADMLFDVKDVVRKTYDLGIIHGTSGVELVPEGSDYPRVSTEEGKVKVALYKFLLITGNTLTARLKATRGKLAKAIAAATTEWRNCKISAEATV